jgi:hypothetical protein
MNSRSNKFSIERSIYACSIFFFSNLIWKKLKIRFNSKAKEFLHPCLLFGRGKRCKKIFLILKISSYSALAGSFLAFLEYFIPKGGFLYAINTIEKSLYLGMMAAWGGTFALITYWMVKMETIRVNLQECTVFLLVCLGLICLFYMAFLFSSVHKTAKDASED